MVSRSAKTNFRMLADGFWDDQTTDWACRPSVLAVGRAEGLLNFSWRFLSAVPLCDISPQGCVELARECLS